MGKGEDFWQPPAQRATGGHKEPGGGAGGEFSFPTGLAAAIALVVAGLAAVGVSGDTLTRAVRNEPTVIAWSIIVALVAAAALVVLNLIGKGKGLWRWVGMLVTVLLLAIVVGAAAVAIHTGAEQITDREQPLVSLQAATDEDLTTITIDVKATGLQTTDQLLVQVIGLTEFTDRVDVAKIELCERGWASSSVPPAQTIDEYVASVDKTPHDPGDADLLTWSRIGPDQSGAIETTFKVQFPAGTYQGVCAWGPLPDRRTPRPNQELSADDNQELSADDVGRRNSAAYLRLNDVTAGDESSDTTVTS